MPYDIIGDIHGHTNKLENLLSKLGYKKQKEVYSHPENRQVVFVGDFIDRGPKIREALHLVKNMCDAGTALAVMGNHEFNAICFHTPHIERGGFFRSHDLKEIEQHLETLRQFKGHEQEWKMFLEWFKELPLFLELDDFRVVHACWDNHHIDWIRQHYHGITPEFLGLATNKENPGNVYEIIESTLKGKEMILPDGITVTDKDGAVRNECRIKWWTKHQSSPRYGDVLLHCPPQLADQYAGENETFYYYPDSKPVFFGHYWLKGLPLIENPSAVCLDYSVAKGGILVAARIEKAGEKLDIKLVY